MCTRHFCDDTRVGKHGVNAQFWRNYIDMVNIYMLFSRAIGMLILESMLFDLRNFSRHYNWKKTIHKVCSV